MNRTQNTSNNRTERTSKTTNAIDSSINDNRHEFRKSKTPPSPALQKSGLFPSLPIYPFPPVWFTYARMRELGI